MSMLATNAFSSRQQLLEKIFDPRRDIDDECGYPKTIDDEQYRAMYDRELGNRVVNIYPEETWKRLPRVYEDADPATETEFEKALEEFEDRMNLFHYLQRADELSGVGQYGVILWGLNDGKGLKDPVEGSESWEEETGKPQTTGGNHDVIFIRVLDASLVRVSRYETDPTKPRFGKPTEYNLQLHDPRTQEAGAQVSMPDTKETAVHWTRITHVADNRKTSETLGTPRMQPVWNRLYDLRKILGGNGEMFWRGGFPGLALQTQAGLENAELDEEKTRQMMSDYMNGLQRYLALTGMEAKSLAPQIADPTSSFETQIKAICVNIGVPYRVFMGIEEGVVSGDQATMAWDGRLRNRQTRYVGPMIINVVIQRLIDYGALPPTSERRGWTVEWPELADSSELDKANVGVKKTEALAKYVVGGVDALIPPMQFLTIVCGMEEQEAEAILEAAVEHIEGIDNPDEITPGRLPIPDQLEETVVVEEDDEE